MSLQEVGATKRNLYTISGNAAFGPSPMYTCPPGVIATVELVSFETDYTASANTGQFRVGYYQTNGSSLNHLEHSDWMDRDKAPQNFAGIGATLASGNFPPNIGEDFWVARGNAISPKKVKLYEGQMIMANNIQGSPATFVIAVEEEPVNVTS